MSNFKIQGQISRSLPPFLTPMLRERAKNFFPCLRRCWNISKVTCFF